MVGLKDRPDVPKTGWKQVGEVEDLGAKSGTCDRDEKAIRYVYTMHHPDWGYARVGSGCARLMMGYASQHDLDDDAWHDTEASRSANGIGADDRKRESAGRAFVSWCVLVLVILASLAILYRRDQVSAVAYEAIQKLGLIDQ